MECRGIEQHEPTDAALAGWRFIAKFELIPEKGRRGLSGCAQVVFDKGRGGPDHPKRIAHLVGDARSDSAQGCELFGLRIHALLSNLRRNPSLNSQGAGAVTKPIRSNSMMKTM